MKLYEDMVSEYLTANGLAFVCPQFRADRTPFGEASVAEPDFVVIDFEKKDVAVVEVSAAYNLDVLFQKIRNRHQRWYEPIHHKLLSTNTIRPDWPEVRAIIFIRREWVANGGNGWAEDQIPDDDVTFVGLEDVAFGYSWYHSRLEGLPNRFKNHI